MCAHFVRYRHLHIPKGRLVGLHGNRPISYIWGLRREAQRPKKKFQFRRRASRLLQILTSVESSLMFIQEFEFRGGMRVNFHQVLLLTFPFPKNQKTVCEVARDKCSMSVSILYFNNAFLFCLFQFFQFALLFLKYFIFIHSIIFEMMRL